MHHRSPSVVTLWHLLSHPFDEGGAQAISVEVALSLRKTARNLADAQINSCCLSTFFGELGGQNIHLFDDGLLRQKLWGFGHQRGRDPTSKVGQPTLFIGKRIKDAKRRRSQT